MSSENKGHFIFFIFPLHMPFIYLFIYFGLTVWLELLALSWVKVVRVVLLALSQPEEEVFSLSQLSILYADFVKLRMFSSKILVCIHTFSSLEYMNTTGVLLSLWNVFFLMQQKSCFRFTKGLLSSFPTETMLCCFLSPGFVMEHTAFTEKMFAINLT